MNTVLQEVKGIRGEGCVTVILNTHRTRPDNDKDPIVLKKLLGEAENRLHGALNRGIASGIMDRLNEMAAKIDHSHNLEGLVLFANPEFQAFTRLPVPVEDRVVIDRTFATRDLIRALHRESGYYVLVLSRRKARLLEAYSDKMLHEFGGDFPMDEYLYATDKLKLSTRKGQDNLIEEFFNRVDKAVWESTKDDPKPLVVATETRNFDHYLKITDRKEHIVGHINRNRDDEAGHHIVRDAWQEVHTMIENRNRERLDELREAGGNNRVLTDYNDLWQAIEQGRGKTLFVQEGHFQPAIQVGDRVQIADGNNTGNPGYLEDLLDELIERTLSRGGDIVFAYKEELGPYAPAALVTRY